jgi:hypothetical protein
MLNVRAKLEKLAKRVFIDKGRNGSQWFRMAFSESYQADIEATMMPQEFIKHGLD